MGGTGDGGLEDFALKCKKRPEKLYSEPKTSHSHSLLQDKHSLHSAQFISIAVVSFIFLMFLFAINTGGGEGEGGGQMNVYSRQIWRARRILLKRVQNKAATAPSVTIDSA